ncbi:toll/interleukin-1 receptor domain-containing protein [Virgisporangium aurantiacum]|uniref:toll/interleukin-1 receptor domain-containing protein n=1 Tax=Virgisporangium aurantiacum TaxID=175570 RepID=UPI0019500633|nr:toll/interleukin-1 receptor domain-containing protein [Virgisporangium aurantiacum]
MTVVMPQVPRKIAVCYSHRDARYRNELWPHLKRLEIKQQIEIFADTCILPGEDWRSAIEDALCNADVAVPLYSPDFLASVFIQTVELPQVLRRAEAGRLTILALVVRPCAFRRLNELNRYQTVNNPKKPLSDLRLGERDRWYDEVARLVEG